MEQQQLPEPISLPMGSTALTKVLTNNGIVGVLAETVTYPHGDGTVYYKVRGKISGRLYGDFKLSDLTFIGPDDPQQSEE